MKNYIIDPAVFYWINAFEMAKIVCGIIGFMLFVGGIAALISYIYNYYMAVHYGRDGKLDEDYTKYMKLSKKISIATFVSSLIFLLLLILVPNKSTSIEMIVAKTATYDNVNWTVQQVKEVIDYIVSSIQGL